MIVISCRLDGNGANRSTRLFKNCYGAFNPGLWYAQKPLVKGYPAVIVRIFFFADDPPACLEQKRCLERFVTDREKEVNIKRVLILEPIVGKAVLFKTYPDFGTAALKKLSGTFLDEIDNLPAVFIELEAEPCIVGGKRSEGCGSASKYHHSYAPGSSILCQSS